MKIFFATAILLVALLPSASQGWTRVNPSQTPPIQAEIPGWERIVFAPAINSAVGALGYQMGSSENQNALMAYDIAQNRWNILDINGSGGTRGDYICAGGHDFLKTCYDENLHAIVTPSAFAMPYNGSLYCQYDVRGNIGRLYFRAESLGNLQDNPGTCFDPDSNCIYYAGGSNGTNFCRYKPSENRWKILPACPVSISLQTIAYDKKLKKVIVPGGAAYDPASNTWGSGPSLSGDPVYNELLQKTEGLSQVNYAQYTRGIVFSPFNNLYVSVEPGGGGYSAAVYTEPSSAAAVKPPLTFSRETYPSDAGWKTLGGPVFNTATGWAREPALAVHNGELFLAWGEYAPANWGNSGGSLAYLAKWNGPSWQKAATLGRGTYSDYPCLLSDNGSLYIGVDDVALYSGAAALHYRYFNGAVDTLGKGPKADTFPDMSKLPRIVSYKGQIHSLYITSVFWRTYGGLGHSVWNSGTGKWNVVDTQVVVAPYSITSVPAVFDNEFSAAVKGDSIVAAFTSEQRAGKPMSIGTKVYNGTTWGDFAKISASADTMVTTYPCLATNEAKTELYIAYLKRPFRGRKNNELFVEHFNGNAWTPIGGSLNVNGQNKDAWAFRPSLAVNSAGVVYVAWTEHVWGSCPQVYVAHWDGQVWVNDFAQGTSLNNDGTNGSAQGASLTFQNDKPTVAWSEHIFGEGRFRKIFVKQSDVVVTSEGLVKDRGLGLTLFPNPARNLVTFRTAGELSGLAVYDLSGRIIARPSTAFRGGESIAFWHPQSAAAGVYVIRARIGKTLVNQKVTLLK